MRMTALRFLLVELCVIAGLVICSILAPRWALRTYIESVLENESLYGKMLVMLTVKDD